MLRDGGDDGVLSLTRQELEVQRLMRRRFGGSLSGGGGGGRRGSSARYRYHLAHGHARQHSLTFTNHMNLAATPFDVLLNAYGLSEI